MSIVHDFAVLYSSRVHQKDKKWSDGRLKYYEFNKKIEVLSDEGFLVSSDFYPSGAKPPLESGIFEDRNTYKLPNGKLVVEFSEYLGCAERDISKLFQKHSQVDIKKEPIMMLPERRIKIELHPMAHSEISKPMAPRVGLGRPKKATRQTKVTRFVLKMSMEEKLVSYCKNTPQSRIRIPSGSNRLCIRLYKELGIQRPLEVTPMKPVNLKSEISVKTEPQGTVGGFELLGTSTMEADMIQDLSEFEEDEEFMDMVNQLRNGA